MYKYKDKKYSKSKKQKGLLLLIAALALLAGGLFTLEATNVIDLRHSSDDEKIQGLVSSNSNTGDSNAITSSNETDNNNASTPQSTNAKENILQNGNSPSGDTSNTKKVVTPVITSASKSGATVAIFSYVSGVIEDGGTCTFTFSGSTTITYTSQGVANASNTDCRLSKSDSRFSSGSWKVTLSYSSTKASGKSAVTPVL